MPSVGWSLRPSAQRLFRPLELDASFLLPLVVAHLYYRPWRYAAGLGRSRADAWAAVREFRDTTDRPISFIHSNPVETEQRCHTSLAGPRRSVAHSFVNPLTASAETSCDFKEPCVADDDDDDDDKLFDKAV